MPCHSNTSLTSNTDPVAVPIAAPRTVWCAGCQQRVEVHVVHDCTGMARQRLAAPDVAEVDDVA